jgi:hypothetical protein
MELYYLYLCVDEIAENNWIPSRNRRWTASTSNFTRGSSTLAVKMERIRRATFRTSGVFYILKRSEEAVSEIHLIEIEESRDPKKKPAHRDSW